MTSDYYLQFENKFRGNRKTIIKRFSMYDSLIELCIRDNREVSLLDIGCGRGEWLEKWKEGIPNSRGIEQDLNMCNLCKSFGLDVINGKAIDILSSLESNSISIITIFHMIEHIDNEELSLLLHQCHRVLSKEGILIMETPSIDNLLVSSKLFYLDSTHINHINPDRITFELESLGFVKANYFYINGGPLQHASSIKMTRLMNGVAQDLLIIASKCKVTHDLLFNENLEWQFELSQAPSTLEAASNFDYESERLYNEQNKLILDLNQEINFLKERLNLFENKLSTITKLLLPLIKIIKYFKKIIFFICHNIFITLVNYRPTRLFLNSKYMLLLIKLSLKILPIQSSNITLNKVILALNKVQKIDSNSNLFNQKLLIHYENSGTAANIKNILFRKILGFLK